MEEYNCTTVCNGKQFWLYDKADPSLVPRKCSQSTIQFCQHVTSARTTVVRKTFHKPAAYQLEKRILQRLSKISGFPQILQTNDELHAMHLSNCGEPIRSGNIPKDCYQQVQALGRSLFAAKIRHNDLVPHNFLIDKRRISLIDFGRSSIIGEGEDGQDGDASQQQHKVAQLKQQKELISLANILCNRKALIKYQKEQLKPKYTTAVARLQGRKHV